LKLVVNVDGGARGNPGPAAVGVVVREADGGVLEQHAELIGEATNNVAEYRALMLGIERAIELGADEVELIGDSELVVKQVLGEYKVKNAGIKPFHRAVTEALAELPSWSIRHVRREQNSQADELVNRALDG
jgi:ribonuclease HI